MLVRNAVQVDLVVTILLRYLHVQASFKTAREEQLVREQCLTEDTFD